MAKEYQNDPVSDGLGLSEIVKGLAQDLDKLRSGKISVAQAMASAALAKQVFNGARIYLNAARLLSDSARDVTPTLPRDEGNTIDGKAHDEGTQDAVRREGGPQGGGRRAPPQSEGEGLGVGGEQGERDEPQAFAREPHPEREAQGETPYREELAYSDETREQEVKRLDRSGRIKG